MNDEMAIGAIQTFQKNGVVIPDDIAVAGFDNITYAEFCNPPLTTVSQPAEDIGKTSFQMLHQIIDGKKLEQEQIVLPHKFIKRGEHRDQTEFLIGHPTVC